MPTVKITSQKREGNKVALEVEAGYAEFLKAVDQTITEAGKEMTLPGFRAGKAPREMVEKALNRDAVESQAAQNLISRLYPELLDETKIEPVDYPSVEIIQQEKDKPFIFKVMVDVYPEVKLGKYKGIEIEKMPAKVTEDDVIKVLGNLQNRFARIGADGKKELLPLDDDFAKKVSRFGSLAELKEEVRTALQKDRAAESEADIKNKLIAEVASKAKVDIPPGMIERETDMMLDELRASLSQSGLTFEDYLKAIKKEEKTMRQELRKSAELRVRGKIVLRAVADEEKMKISVEEMETEIKKLAATSGEKIEDLKERLETEGKKYVEDYMLRQKALDFLVEKAKIK